MQRASLEGAWKYGVARRDVRRKFWKGLKVLQFGIPLYVQSCLVLIAVSYQSYLCDASRLLAMCSSNVLVFSISKNQLRVSDGSLPMNNKTPSRRFPVYHLGRQSL